MSKPKFFTVSLPLNFFLDPSSFNNYGGLFAMSVVYLIPVVTIFFIFQRLLVEEAAYKKLPILLIGTNLKFYIQNIYFYM